VVKVQNVQLSTPLTGTGISELAKQMIKEPFVGCNCYYLLVGYVRRRVHGWTGVPITELSFLAQLQQLHKCPHWSISSTAKHPACLTVTSHP
jgi:hypothetical protein